MNAAEEAVAEELLPNKELFIQQLYFNKITKQLLQLVFVFTAVANLVTEAMNSIAKVKNLTAKPTNSIANGMNSTVKVTSSTANGTVNCKGDKFNCKYL